MTMETKVPLFRPATPNGNGSDGDETGAKKRDTVWAHLTLPPGLKLVSQRWTHEGWSGSFKYLDQEVFVLRERLKGTIECAFRPYNRVSKKLGAEVRRRTGKNRIDEALDAALIDFIHPEHQKCVLTGPVPREQEQDGSPEPVKDPGFEDIAIIARSRGRLHENPGQRSHEEKCLDLARVIWGNKPQNLMGQADVDRFYDVRLAGFQWPRHLRHRRPLTQDPKRVTIQKELETLVTILNRVLGDIHPGTGRPYLAVNRLQELKIGQHAKAQRPAAHPDRYNWVFHWADESVEMVRGRGLDRSFYREDEETGELVLRPNHRFIPNVVPGITRAMLVMQYGHGMRPGSWRHIRLDTDVGLDVRAVRRLIRSLRLLGYDEKIPDTWAHHWPWGAIVYRKEFLKGKADRRYERVVPLSEAMLEELLLYLERRRAWLADMGATSPWLFPSPTDPSKPISDADARELLYAAEELARANAEERRGEEYAEEVLQDLEQTAWYGYRRAWKTLRNALGWHENKNSNYCGGWSTKVGQISEVVYARLLPLYMLAVVEGLSVVEAVQRYGESEELKLSIDIAPDKLPGE